MLFSDNAIVLSRDVKSGMKREVKVKRLQHNSTLIKLSSTLIRCFRGLSATVVWDHSCLGMMNADKLIDDFSHKDMQTAFPAGEGVFQQGLEAR